MEFKRGNSERRQDRRICPKCERRCGRHKTCGRCGKPTKARIQVTWTAEGRRKRQLTNCWREEDAREVLRGIEADYWRQQRLGVTRDVGGSLADAVEAFEQSRAQCSRSWRQQLRKALYPLRDGLGPDSGIVEITKDDLEQYLAEGLATRASATMRSYMLVVRCFFNWLEDEGWIRLNPARRIKLPKAKTRYQDCLLPEQVAPVLTAAFQVASDFGPIMMAIVLGSFRKGELVNLRRADVDVRNRWARVTDFAGDEQAEAWSTKTDSSVRAVPLHPLLADALSRVAPIERPDGSASPWMFPVSDPRRRSRFRDKAGRLQLAVGDRRSPDTNYFGRCLRRALELAEIPQRVTVHGLRRTFAVLLQEAGAPDYVIRQAMGHAPRGVTERHYLPRRDRVVQQWVDRIEIGDVVATNLPPVLDSGASQQPPGPSWVLPAPKLLQ